MTNANETHIAEQPPTTEPEQETSAQAASEDETIAALVTELADAKRAADEAQDQALRAHAELQNFRKRKEREAEDRIAQANARLLLDLLPVVDDFERAFDSLPASLEGEEAAWADGFRLILRKLQSVLEREGVTAIDASGAFDPTWHEAISVEPSGDTPSGHVIAELRRGYRLRDRVLRPSVVRVAQ